MYVKTYMCVIRSCIVLNVVYNLRILFDISVEQMAVNRRCGQTLIIRDMDSLPRSISQCIRSHVVLFDMKYVLFDMGWFSCRANPFACGESPSFCRRFVASSSVS